MAKKTEEFDYASKSTELERIVNDLQSSEIDITEATKLHAAGLKLLAELEDYLNRAEVEVHKHIVTK
jgi:exodeoxyribonuclease VII small subunit